MRKEKAKVRKISIPNIPRIQWATHSQMNTTLTSAVAVWKRLMVDAFHYWDTDAYTEQELSEKTWLDCSPSSYALDPDKFRRRNDDVIAFIRKNHPSFKVIRIYASQIRGGVARTVICHTDNVNALRLNNRRISAATTMTSNAIQDDERLELNSAIPVVQQFVTQMCDKLPYGSHRNLEIMSDMFVALGQEMRKTLALENKSKEDILAESIKKVMDWRAQLEDKSEPDKTDNPEDNPDEPKT